MNPAKNDLRQKILSQRQAMSAGEVRRRSEKIFAMFSQNSPALLGHSALSVALYYPIKGEVETRSFFDFFKKINKTRLFPKVTSEGLKFFPVSDLAQLQVGSFGIAEPIETLNIDAQVPDVAFVPGIVFSFDRHRIGFGLGHYDRVIEKWKTQKKITLIGLAYDFQMVPDLVSEVHDQQLSFVISENEIYPKVVV